MFDKSLKPINIHECVAHTDDLTNLFTGQLQSKLTGLMLAYDFKNMNETLKMIYELDDLIFGVMNNSSCKEIESLAIFKLIDDKHPIDHNDVSIFFNTTEEIKIELSSIPQFIAFNNRKLTTAQATNSTEDKTKFLKIMGDQLGMATKLYEIKGKNKKSNESSNWDNTIFLVCTVGILFSTIAFCVITDRKQKVADKSTNDIEEEDNTPTLTVNQ